MLHNSVDTYQIARHSASRSDQWLIFISKLLDAMVIASTLFASVLVYRPAWDTRYSMAALLAAMLFFLLAEIAGIYRPWRGETDALHKMEKRVEYDLWYIRNWSLWLDIKIIMLTAARGFTGKNAY